MSVDDHWDEGSAYERYIGRWSRQLAPLFLDWLDLGPGLDWLDVGCGTGALTEAILDRCSPRSVIGVEPSDGFRKTAQANLAGRATILRGSAEALPVPAESVDVLVSGLVLNFIADSPLTLVQMMGWPRHGGTMGAYVWDYAGRMEFLRAFWDAAASLDPAAEALDEGTRFPICRPDNLGRVFRLSLNDVEVEALDIATPFASFEELWQPFLGGQGPAPAYAMSLSEEGRAKLKEALCARVPIASDGSISLIARAWAARGSS
jgi:SAM-dependent methyltransferase